MYLYDWQTGALYCDMSSQVPLFYVPVYQPPLLQPQPFVGVESPPRQAPQVEREEPAPAATPRRKRTERCRVTTGRPARNSHKKNIRNIIPNLARKILAFICTEDSRAVLEESVPGITQFQINRYYQFAQTRRAALNFYIGNRDLARIWYNSNDPPEYLRIGRVLSKWFLQNECVSSIVLSRRMKSSLKIEHLRYRHKLLAILQSGGIESEEETDNENDIR